MKLLIQPGSGVWPLLKAIEQARELIQIAIFRFDRSDLEAALAMAVERGVFVHALIASANGGGERHLQALEGRLRANRIAVSRTADDLLRYHGKYMIVDRKKLYILAFNFTHLDMERSRSFGVVTTKERFVAEAVNLFEADATQQPFQPGSNYLVVSPHNSRKRLYRFIRGAKKQLLIYDPKIGDPEMVRALEARRKAGVDVRIIGKIRRATRLTVREMPHLRQHARSMLRDGKYLFLGSQSLRREYLESRREVGIIVNSGRTVGQIARIFESDWNSGRESETPAKKGFFKRLFARAAARFRAR